MNLVVFVHVAKRGGQPNILRNAQNVERNVAHNVTQNYIAMKPTLVTMLKPTKNLGRRKRPIRFISLVKAIAKNVACQKTLDTIVDDAKRIGSVSHAVLKNTICIAKRI